MSRLSDLEKLMAVSAMDDKLSRVGVVTGSGNGNYLMKLHNRKFGTMFKRLEDVLSYYRLDARNGSR